MFLNVFLLPSKITISLWKSAAINCSNIPGGADVILAVRSQVQWMKTTLSAKEEESRSARDAPFLCSDRNNLTIGSYLAGCINI